MEDHLYLAHHGIKGMKWGVRRFQNFDGSLTSAGRTRYGGGPGKTKYGAAVMDGDGFTNRRTKKQQEYVDRHGIAPPPRKQSPYSRSLSPKQHLKNHRDKREARKDAKEFARAKMYYGEGAGTRRKLIKATVAEKSKKSKVYADEFEKSLESQNMADHAKKAKTERKIKDAKNAAGKVGRGVINIAAGNPQRAAASVLAVYGVMKATGLDKMVVEAGQDLLQMYYDTHPTYE